MNRILFKVSLGVIAFARVVAFAQPDPLFTIQNDQLFLPAANLTTNGIAGLTNQAPHLMVSSVSTTSSQGGTVSLVNTQVWVQRFGGQYPAAGDQIVVD